ncbi:EAL domain-containing protein [Undibacterium sp. CY18W]|uniref:EAL domain-containing protein n=1 Tax=Undibacterium hunanense TaxID=2762292 RepID=A0ABR6ZN84_9BURK|nr:EAL domain-containing protein [Undibacterium hunanense]MBC3916890.1 EAL domain-containing protein [Undibacterium hunanense]
MRLHSLESRVVTLFIGLLLTLQLAGFFVIRNTIDSNARNAIEESLKLNEKILLRLLDQNAQKLIQGAIVLAKEYAFREAIGTHDTETIVSTLSNHGKRIGSDLTMLVGLDRRITASSSTAASDDLSHSLQQSVAALIQTAEKSGSAASTTIVDGKPYQMVVVPIEAPVTISWVVMAIPIGKTLVSDMHELSLMQISLLTAEKKATGNSGWISNVSTLSDEQAAELTQLIPPPEKKVSYLPNIQIDEDQYSTRIMQLAQNEQVSTIAVLQLSISQAVAPYKKLQLNLLVLTIFGAIIASVFSAITARRITGPVTQLAETARRLGAGDYTATIDVKQKDEIGDLARTFTTMRDGIAQREKEIRRMAYWDTLTNLPNRALFTEMLEEAIVMARSHEKSCYVLMMDLDRFKHVNDVMGHRFGDVLLNQVAIRLSDELGSGGTKPARLGGDEFAILLPNATKEEAQNLADRILRALEKPISIEDQTVDLGAGVGIAGFPEHASDAQNLLSRVEVAMYAAKQRKSGAVIYSPDIDKSSQKSLSLLSELRAALEQQAFRMYVQPKVGLNNGQVIAVEALVRWIHPERGFIFPDQFIPFAEQTGFIRQLTHWIMNEAARVCSLWNSQGLHLKISVNISTRDLMDQDLPIKFAHILQQHQVDASSFCLEITESAIMDDPVRAFHTLDRLHAMGLDLSIDDFGTGYSSLAYLKRLPVNELKIDKSFVLKMEKDIDDTKIVKSTIDLGHNMSLRVVAEGVENTEVMALLKELGCDQAQGYFISKPMPSTDLPAWLEKWQQNNPPS